MKLHNCPELTGKHFSQKCHDYPNNIQIPACLCQFTSFCIVVNANVNIWVKTLLGITRGILIGCRIVFWTGTRFKILSVAAYSTFWNWCDSDELKTGSVASLSVLSYNIIFVFTI